MKCRVESAVKWAVNAELSIFATDNNTSNAKPKKTHSPKGPESPKPKFYRDARKPNERNNSPKPQTT